jgi:hypothetical protein
MRIPGTGQEKVKKHKVRITVDMVLFFIFFGKFEKLLSIFGSSGTPYRGV